MLTAKLSATVRTSSPQAKPSRQVRLHALKNTADFYEEAFPMFDGHVFARCFTGHVQPARLFDRLLAGCHKWLVDAGVVSGQQFLDHQN